MEADSGATAASKPPCGVDAVDAFRCTDPRDDAPACAKTLDEQQARRAIDRGPANDVREFCRRDLEIPPHELDPALLRKLRSVGAADDSDELCCYSACVPLDVAPAPVDAPRGGITLCIGAPESTSQPAAAYPECPAALRSRTFRDTGVLDVAQTGAERAGTADPRLSSKATARPCCYDFPRNVQVGP